MIKKKELSDFAEFCFSRYNLEISPEIIKDYINTIDIIEQPENNTHNMYSSYIVNECSSGEMGCSHISFDSVRCDNCEYFTPPFPK